MRRSEWVLAICGLVVLVGFGIGSGLAYTGPPLETTSIQQHDGHYWVLAANDSTAKVYQFDDDWKRIDTHEIGARSIPTELTSDNSKFVGLAPARGNGWWLLHESGTVAQFGEGWEYSKESVDISSKVSDVTDIARSPNGWWVLGDSVVHYGLDWTAPVETTISSRNGHPKGLAHAGSLRLVETSTSNHPSGWVHRYGTDGSSVMSPPFERTNTLDWEANSPVDVTRSGGNWFVLERDGHILTYTDSWQYTGDKQLVVESANQPFLFGDGAFLVLTGVGVIAFWLVGVAILVVRSSLSFRAFAWLLATGSAGVVCSVLLVAYLLPSPLSVVYRLPDIALGGILLGLLAFEFAVMRAYERDTSLRRLVSVERSAGLRNSGLLADLVTFCLIQVPLLVTAWLFVS
ncbi:MAG: hypothetical protein ABEI98_11345 [Halorhabdus sp.]